jgi:hypothetical protein
MFGTMDADFADNKFIGSEVFLTPFIGESIMYRTVIFSFLDLVKGFTIDTFAYDYNKNTRQLGILGRAPKGNGMVVQIAKKIDANRFNEVGMKLYKTVTEYQETEEIKTREFTADDIKDIMDHHNGKTKLDGCLTIVMDENPRLQMFIQICPATFKGKYGQIIFIDSLFLLPKLNEEKSYYVRVQGETVMQYQDNFLEKMIGKQVVDFSDKVDEYSPFGISTQCFLKNEIRERYGVLGKLEYDIDFLDNYR